MESFTHPHLVKILGVCLDSASVPLIVSPYMSQGSLLPHLKQRQSELVLSKSVKVSREKVTQPFKMHIQSFIMYFTTSGIKGTNRTDFHVPSNRYGNGLPFQ